MTSIIVNCIGDRRVTVPAHVYREWAAHMGVRDDLQLRPDWWVVTHVPTGRAIVSATGQLTEAEAIELAAALGERVPAGIVPDTHAGMAPRAARMLIRSVIFDVRGEVLV